MDELEQTLQRVLSNPEEMEKISRMAAQLFNSGGAGGGQEAEEARRESESAPDKTALLNAIAPYLREDRRKKLQKAMRLARAARVAGVVLNEFGGEGGGL